MLVNIVISVNRFRVMSFEKAAIEMLSLIACVNRKEKHVIALKWFKIGK